uniref:Uncharacterized protein n=1 Tax=Neobodo designis TaxID=312471 RepID=A0A7S1QP99_NEODS|mmetsp:Transcript_49729/g.153688  ORF Transcript_49729/g.153688 Transcript_49729/m.153688 type:complete len:185 (+) Transcript_49729:45-599(+)
MPKPPFGLLQPNPEDWADDCFFLSRIAAARADAHPLGEVPLAPGLVEKARQRKDVDKRIEQETGKPLSAAAADVLRRHGFTGEKAADSARKVAATPSAGKRKTWGEALSPKELFGSVKAFPKAKERVIDMKIDKALSSRGEREVRRLGRAGSPSGTMGSSPTATAQAFDRPAFSPYGGAAGRMP